MKIREWVKSRATIRKSLIITFAILIIVPIMILGSYAYTVASGNLIQQTKIAMLGNADVIAYGIENNAKREKSSSEKAEG